MNPPFELPMRQRTVHAGDGESVTTQSVYCPRRGRSVSVDECEACDHARAIRRVMGGGGGVVCDGPWLAATQATSGSPAARTPIANVMSTGVRCVLEDVRVDELTELLLTHGVSGLPVVDLDGQPIGVVSKTDLMRDPGPGAVVADVMTPIAFTLDERAPLTHAAALMAIEGVHRVPVVAEDGQVVGILSALDIARWLAKQEGLI
jgi:CBS domain-containing protein